MNRTYVLALLPLFVGLVHSFPWDIVVGEKTLLKFYYSGTLEHTEHIPLTTYIRSVTYDPVHDRVLFADDYNTKSSILSYDLSTRKIKSLVTGITDSVKTLEYDPVLQLLFWKEGDKIISYSLPLKPAWYNKAVDGKLLVTLNHSFWDIAVDSCGGFIYWTTKHKIERAAFDGSEREVLIEGLVYQRRGLAIDQQARKMYWIEETTSDQFSIERADLNGKNRETFYLIGKEYLADALAVSKDFIYWRSYNQKAILQLPKNQQHGVAPIVYSQSSNDCWTCQLTAANYTVKEQTLGIKSCEVLKSLILDVEESYGSICHNYCFQGNCSISAEGHPKCSCNRGYSGERCDVSICKDYCFEGNCSVSSEGQPNCSCNRGYSGEKCEVDACYKHCLNNGVCSLNDAEKPICQCTSDYQGERCDVSICKYYCMQGNCSISTEGQPTCSCNAGYSGERCEVNACHSYCLNNGDCSLNEEDEPVCQCAAGYEGERCDVATTLTDVCICADKSMTQQILRNLRSKMNQVISEELQCTYLVTPLG